MEFSGEFENAKCKMQNAKLMKPFACAKAYFMVIFCMQIPEKHLPTKAFLKKTFSVLALPFSDFAFCILHFAFRALPDKPKFETLTLNIPETPLQTKEIVV